MWTFLALGDVLWMVDHALVWSAPFILALWHIYGDLTTVFFWFDGAVPLICGSKAELEDLAHGSVLACGPMSPLFMDLGFWRIVRWLWCLGGWVSWCIGEDASAVLAILDELLALIHILFVEWEERLPIIGILAHFLRWFQECTERWFTHPSCRFHMVKQTSLRRCPLSLSHVESPLLTYHFIVDLSIKSWLKDNICLCFPRWDLGSKTCVEIM
jgi:hypothetical protein